MKKETLDRHLRSILKDAQKAYREALAAQIRGEEDGPAWDRFAEASSALLLASWLAGAHGVTRRAKIPQEVIDGFLEEDTPVTFALPALKLEGFGAKYMAPIARWFRRLVPISRKSWELLIEAARRSAMDVASHEEENALADIRKNPSVDALLRGMTYREGVNRVKRITDSTFFVTGMNAEQTRQTQELVARVIEERPAKSTVGKWIRAMNLGDFVTTTQLITGTDLSSARLETVLRTNTNRATTEGAAEVLRDETVQAFVPLVQYSATKDPRTRPEHLAMDGYIGRMEDFDRQGITPPCGFNCRCALIPVPASVALEKRWTNAAGVIDYAAITRHNGQRQALIDTGKFPDPGFVNA